MGDPPRSRRQVPESFTSKKKGSGESIPNPRISSAVAAAATVPFSFTWTEHWWTIEGTASVASISSASEQRRQVQAEVCKETGDVRFEGDVEFWDPQLADGDPPVGHGRFVKESGRVGAELAHQARQPVAVVGR